MEDAFKKIDPGTYAAVRSGKVKVLGYRSDIEQFGVAQQVEFVKHNTGSADYVEAIRRKVGTGEITYVRVPDTPYSFVLLNGEVQPVLLDEEKWEVWHIAGLGKYFSWCRSISPGERQMRFGGVTGLADTWLDWSIDFGDPKKGLLVRFNADGAW